MAWLAVNVGSCHLLRNQSIVQVLLRNGLFLRQRRKTIHVQIGFPQLSFGLIHLRLGHLNRHFFPGKFEVRLGLGELRLGILESASYLRLSSVNNTCPFFTGRPSSK